MFKPLLMALLLLTPPTWRGLAWVRNRNAAAAAGQAAYARGDMEAAAQAFATAVAARPGAPGTPALLLNLGHAQHRAGQLAAARATYGQLLAAGVPPAIGSVARQQLAVLAAEAGETTPALGLLHQALLLDPTNAGARYDYEVLSSYLAKHRETPRITPPPTGAAPAPKPATSPKQPAPKAPGQPAPSAGTKPGADQRGEVANPDQPAPTPNGPPQPRPNDAGAPNPAQPSAAPGGAAAGRRAPAARGPATPMPTGAQPGPARGLDASARAPAMAGRSQAAGTDVARAADVRLQTQRERLKAMSLTPAQARQLLDELGAQEQQYLQQVPRRPAAAPRPGQPTW